MPTPEELFEKWTPWAIEGLRNYNRRSRRKLFEKELESAALSGLWEASLKFDESRNVAFPVFARLFIRSQIVECFRRIKFVKRTAEQPVIVPIDELYYTPVDGRGEQIVNGDFLLSAINSLNGRNREFAELRWFRGMRLKQIGAQMNLSESRIAQIHKEVLTMLKEWAEKR